MAAELSAAELAAARQRRLDNLARQAAGCNTEDWERDNVTFMTWLVLTAVGVLCAALAQKHQPAVLAAGIVLVVAGNAFAAVRLYRHGCIFCLRRPP